jgi:AraC family transcriptional activator of pobA
VLIFTANSTNFPDIVMTNRTLHSIDELGISKVSLNFIRVEPVENRMIPKVAFPHRHDFYQIMLITEGFGFHQIDFERYPVKKQQVFIMKPGQVHTWGLKPKTKGLMVEFNAASIQTGLSSIPDLLSKIDSSQDMAQLPKKEFEQLLQPSLMMMRELDEKKAFSDVCLQSYLIGFLAQLSRITDPSPLTRDVSVLERLKALIEEHYREERAVDFYAQKLKLTSKALTMKVTRMTGHSPRHFIQARSLLEAKRLLAYSSLSIADIGFETGLEDANYFSRFFKAHEKMSPQQFRESFSVGGHL